jgi:hypothetical protein
MQTTPAHLKERFLQEGPVKRLLYLLERVGCGALIIFTLLALLLQVFAIAQGTSDFCQDYQAVQHLLTGAPIYAPVHCWAGHLYVPAPVEYDAHPPASVLFFLPLSLLPYMPASLLWGLLCLGAYLASGLLLLREPGWLSLRGVTAFLVFSLLWQPLTLSEQVQNVMQVLLLLLVAAWILERRGHPRLAGILLGIAALLKVWPLLLLVGTLLLRRWRVFLAGSVTVVAGIFLSLLVLGFASYAAYLGPVEANERFWIPSDGSISLVSAVTRPFLGYADPPGIPPLFSGLSLNGAALLGEVVAGSFLAGALFLLWRWQQADENEAAALLSQSFLLTIALLTFPLTWTWGLLPLLLVSAMLVLALCALPRPPRWWFAFLAISFLPLLIPSWVVGLAFAFNTWGRQIILELPTMALLLLAIAQAWLLWRVHSSRAAVLDGKTEETHRESC